MLHIVSEVFIFLFSYVHQTLAFWSVPTRSLMKSLYSKYNKCPFGNLELSFVMTYKNIRSYATTSGNTKFKCIKIGTFHMDCYILFDTWYSSCIDSGEAVHAKKHSHTTPFLISATDTMFLLDTWSSWTVAMSTPTFHLRSIRTSCSPP